MQSAQRIPEPWTPEEYLEREEKCATKNELIDGQIYAMAGSSRQHNVIEGNAFAALRALARRCGCQAFTSDMRIHIPTTGLFTYADGLVVCGKPEFFTPKQRGSTDTLQNPTIIVEVLSPATEEYDRGDKFNNYCSIPSLSAVLFLWQSEPRAELRSRGNGAWQSIEVRSGQIEVPQLNGVLSLAELYDGLPA